MSRKDYELLAGLLRDEIETAEGLFEPIGAEALRNYARRLTIVLKHENPRFDRGRFLTACGIEE